MIAQQCNLRNGNSCQLVADLAMIPIDKASITDDACRFCLKQGKDNAVNYVTLSVSVSMLHRHGLFDPVKHSYLVKAVVATKGPGKILSESLHWIAIPDEGSCYCNSRASVMDVWGPDKCEEEIDTIVGWLMEGAERHGIGWVPKTVQTFVGRKAVELAIRKARSYGKAV